MSAVEYHDKRLSVAFAENGKRHTQRHGHTIPCNSWVKGHRDFKREKGKCLCGYPLHARESYSRAKGTNFIQSPRAGIIKKAFLRPG